MFVSGGVIEIAELDEFVRLWSYRSEPARVLTGGGPGAGREGVSPYMSCHLASLIGLCDMPTREGEDQKTSRSWRRRPPGVWDLMM